MDSYAKIFKQAYEITRNNKFLWILGLFLIGYTGVNFGLGQINPNPVWVQNDMALIVTLIVSVALVILYFRFKAGLIIGIKAILDKTETSLGKLWTASRLFYGRLIGVSFLVQITFVVVLLLIAVPVVYMFDHGFVTRAWTLLTLAVLIGLPVGFIFILTTVIAPLFVVIFDLKIQEALNQSVELIVSSWTKFLGFGLLLMLVSIGVSVLSAIVAALAAVPFVLLTVLSYHREGLMVMNPINWLAIVAAAIVLIALQSGLLVFIQTSWVLFFLQLIKPQKLEEEKVLPVPEIAG